MIPGVSARAPVWHAAGASFVRDVHLCKAARRGRVHCGDHLSDTVFYETPSPLAQDHDGNRAAFEILLVAEILVRRP